MHAKWVVWYEGTHMLDCEMTAVCRSYQNINLWSIVKDAPRIGVRIHVVRGEKSDRCDNAQRMHAYGGMQAGQHCLHPRQACRGLLSPCKTIYQGTLKTCNASDSA